MSTAITRGERYETQRLESEKNRDRDIDDLAPIIPALFARSPLKFVLAPLESGEKIGETVRNAEQRG